MNSQRTLVTLIMIGGMVMMFGCAEDVNLGTNSNNDTIDPPADSPGRVYWCSYTVILNCFSPDDADTFQNFVFWTVTETGYHMNIDPDHHTGDCFCVWDGIWSGIDGLITVAQSPDTAVGCFTCDPSLAPTGVFRREDQNGTLVLKQFEQGTCREFRFWRSRPRGEVANP